MDQVDTHIAVIPRAIVNAPYPTFNQDCTALAAKQHRTERQQAISRL
jgi:hypothetical protein